MGFELALLEIDVGGLTTRVDSAEHKASFGDAPEVCERAG